MFLETKIIYRSTMKSSYLKTYHFFFSNLALTPECSYNDRGHLRLRWSLHYFKSRCGPKMTIQEGKSSLWGGTLLWEALLQNIHQHLCFCSEVDLTKKLTLSFIPNLFFQGSASIHFICSYQGIQSHSLSKWWQPLVFSFLSSLLLSLWTLLK